MISSSKKAQYFLSKYNEVEAIVQVTQIIVSSPNAEKNYWWDVLEKIKNHG